MFGLFILWLSACLSVAYYCSVIKGVCMGEIVLQTAPNDMSESAHTAKSNEKQDIEQPSPVSTKEVTFDHPFPTSTDKATFEQQTQIISAKMSSLKYRLNMVCSRNIPVVIIVQWFENLHHGTKRTPSARFSKHFPSNKLLITKKKSYCVL